VTSKQKRLIQELDGIVSHLGLDYSKIGDYEKAARTPHLERIKKHLIRGEVVGEYTLIDEFLNNRLCHYFFGRKRSFIQLWKTKKFKNFNYYIVEQLSLLEKLRFVKAISKVPKQVAAEIERVNSLRNALAHAFFPENLRGSKPFWKGKDIFTLDGLKRFSEDMRKVHEYFLGEF
jgi:hypothetical protein